MMELASKSLCSGCAACRAVCPKGAITMVADAEGFLFPRVDAVRCISCGKCRKVCPVLVRGDARTPESVFAVLANDDDLRRASSSGGVFSLLAREIFQKGGLVFGAAWDYEMLSVKMVAAQNEDELAALRGSKYVQADIGDVYIQVARALDDGRQILFSGTPCQIAALRRVVGCARENLLTVEVVCHAAPSPLAFRKYAETRMRAAGGKKISRIFSRSKNCSWKRYAMSLSFHDSDIAYLRFLDEDPFLRGFLSELYNRPSCHACSVRELRSGADLTIADYWSVGETLPDMDDDKGTSLVLVNTERGRAAFDAIRPLCRVRESTFADARRVNPAIVRSPLPHTQRGAFFKAVGRTDDFDSLVARLLRPSFARRLRRLAGRVLRRLISICRCDTFREVKKV